MEKVKSELDMEKQKSELDMEKQNAELYLENFKLMRENEKMRKMAERISQENQAWLQIKQKLQEIDAMQRNTSSTSATPHKK